MRALLVLPIIVPLATGGIALAVRKRQRLQGWLSLLGAAGLLLSGSLLLAATLRSGILATQIGEWPAPFGITLVADIFGALMVLLAAIIGLAVVVYSMAGVDSPRKAFGYHALLHVLLAGVCGAFLTGDIFNLYVWFEVMLISSFVLVVLGGERAQLEGGLKYVTLNLIASAVFLAAVGILYGFAGTLNMADLSVRLAVLPRKAFLAATGFLFFIAFGIKAAVFPLFFWLPASYHTPPAAVSALLAGLLTKVGVYALIRVFTLIFTGQENGVLHEIILWVAGLTMLTGVLGAAAQNELRRILSFHIISQIGYMVMGLGLFRSLALAGSLFYIAHHIIVKANLFLVSGVVNHLGGSYQLRELGGLYRDHAGLAAAFLVPALSLAGIPPLSGFFAKLVLVQAGLRARRYTIVATALLVGLLTLFSMTKIWSEVFWRPLPAGRSPSPAGAPPLSLMLPIVGLLALTLAIGLWPAPLLALATRGAAQLVDPRQYVAAVLGERR